MLMLMHYLIIPHSLHFILSPFPTKFNQNMPNHFPFLLLLLLLPSFFLVAPLVSAQSTMADCGANLLPLASCAPFVQGITSAPVQSCCNSIAHLYAQKPGCLCTLLHDSSITSSFPINATLALQLPALCTLHIDPSTCPGVSIASPAGVSFGARPNSTAPAYQVGTGAPHPSSMVFGIHHSDEVRLIFDTRLLVLQLAAVFIALAKFIEP